MTSELPLAKLGTSPMSRTHPLLSHLRQPPMARPELTGHDTEQQVPPATGHGPCNIPPGLHSFGHWLLTYLMVPGQQRKIPGKSKHQRPLGQPVRKEAASRSPTMVAWVGHRRSPAIQEGWKEPSREGLPGTGK